MTGRPSYNYVSHYSSLSRPRHYKSCPLQINFNININSCSWINLVANDMTFKHRLINSLIQDLLYNNSLNRKTLVRLVF